jgi:hypothetical protein
MNDAQKKQFWNTLEQDMGKAVQKDLDKSREALAKLKESETGQEG